MNFIKQIRTGIPDHQKNSINLFVTDITVSPLLYLLTHSTFIF
ncbi:MAG: hypothetical protein JWN76_1946 [Chitinophagaceae bacterium]|nr:hypothetical protein [Chitinophagaceae bacterium]